MLCQKCGKNQATTWYKETVGGQTRELRLCSECAAKLSGVYKSNPFSMESFFSPFFSDSLFPSAAQAIGGGRRCPSCGMTESELRRTGRAGCGDCYHHFKDILLPYIKKLHGAAAHVGTTPAPAADTPAPNPVDGLKSKLADCVKAENYEEAARLRDEIRRLEANQS